MTQPLLLAGIGGGRSGSDHATAVSSPSTLYLADTNVYVTAANDPAVRERFEAFLERHGPLLVSAVVVAEVLIGIRDAARHGAVVQALSAGTATRAFRRLDSLTGVAHKCTVAHYAQRIYFRQHHDRGRHGSPRYPASPRLGGSSSRHQGRGS